MDSTEIFSNKEFEKMAHKLSLILIMQLPIDPYLGLFKVSLPDSPSFKGSENYGERFPINLESIIRNSCYLLLSAVI